ncbi:lysophospholipase [Oceanithermus desulfurans]|uniref:Alpha/beta hydrolase n=2 Tax=Oceanithermus desulfurans TaxID=227924 RepID=A0A511RLP5_9DEIN|nr:lysophospholipase [Oceanithermus desulfurans]MBB6029900.1 hypothetical protein [Oceanithermus desulfurans]GEM89862.1 hypothetical protein ODE01S_12960 [Oceanithermus desulfurans NBRC 100063]
MKRLLLFVGVFVVAFVIFYGVPFRQAGIEYSYKPRIAWADEAPPAVVIFAVSGRCGIHCNAPDDNHEYLTGAGTVEALANAFRRHRFSVYTLAYRAHLKTAPARGPGGKPQYGFLQLEADFDLVQRNWPHTRRVLVGHSHGVNWTHNLLRLHPEWTVDYLIDLDGVCDRWEEDNAAYFAAYERAARKKRWQADPARSCRVEAVPVAGGKRLFDVKDVAYPGAAYNLEVRTRTPSLHDAVPNRRPDGSTLGIETFVTGENHSAILVPGSQALAWVEQTLARIERKRGPARNGAGLSPAFAQSR